MGLVDELSQLFVNRRMFSNEALQAVIQYKYDAPAVKAEIYNTWLKGYNAIAAVNNVLGHIDDAGNIPNFPEREIIKAEALGIRAFVHFDLMRLFAPFMSPDKDGIPYSYDFSKENKKMYSVEDTYKNILADLQKAQNIFKKNKDFEAYDRYFKKQYLHMNERAVWAIKARVFHTKGVKDSAYFYASKVVGFKDYNLVDAGDIDELHNGYITSSECIWGLYSDQFKARAKKRFYNKRVLSDMAFARDDYRTIFDINSYTATNTDYRYTAYFEKRRTGVHFIKFGNDPEEIDKLRLQGINLIRIPEMYYIMAESIYPTNPGEAIIHLNKVLSSRGLEGVKLEDINDDSFADILFKERLKEYWGEGQIFYEYKRLNKSIVNDEGTEYSAGDKIFVLPLPDDENEFGNR
jgi:hypothetical protein